MTRQRSTRALLAGALALAVVAGSGGGALAQGDKITLNMISMAQAGMTTDEMNAVIGEFTALHPDINDRARVRGLRRAARQDRHGHGGGQVALRHHARR